MKQIVSYGGGTQSTAMILMALNGEYNLPRPDFGVYCDTGAEPQFINDYVEYFVEYVKQKYDFTIHKIQCKKGLEHHLLKKPTKSRTGKFYVSATPPFYTLALDGSIGILNRQCTNDFKIAPIKTFINSLVPRGQKYRMWIGISFDERSRMKISTYKKRVNYYPLVDNFIRRHNAIDYVKELGLRSPQRSSCYFCPFHSDNYWKWLKKYHATEFQRACELETNVQTNVQTNDVPFLHSTCKPLDQVVFRNENQLNMFPELIDECDGECGI